MRSAIETAATTAKGFISGAVNAMESATRPSVPMPFVFRRIVRSLVSAPELVHLPCREGEES